MFYHLIGEHEESLMIQPLFPGIGCCNILSVKHCRLLLATATPEAHVGIAYSQHRAVARSRSARADFVAQLVDLFTEADDAAQEAMEPPFDPFDPKWQELEDWDDAIYFNRHGEWPDWGFLRWQEKQMEREWFAEHPDA